MWNMIIHLDFTRGYRRIINSTKGLQYNIF